MPLPQTPCGYMYTRVTGDVGLLENVDVVPDSLSNCVS